MRVTKAMLQKQLNCAIAFQRMTLVLLPAKMEMQIRETLGFVSACQYSIGMVARKNEIGMNGNIRYFVSNVRSAQEAKL